MELYGSLPDPDVSTTQTGTLNFAIERGSLTRTVTSYLTELGYLTCRWGSNSGQPEINPYSGGSVNRHYHATRGHICLPCDQ
jgi:hypothetical protein